MFDLYILIFGLYIYCCTKKTIKCQQYFNPANTLYDPIALMFYSYSKITALFIKRRDMLFIDLILTRKNGGILASIEKDLSLYFYSLIYGQRNGYLFTQ